MERNLVWLIDSVRKLLGLPQRLGLDLRGIEQERRRSLVLDRKMGMDMEQSGSLELTVGRGFSLFLQKRNLALLQKGPEWKFRLGVSLRNGRVGLLLKRLMLFVFEAAERSQG